MSGVAPGFPQETWRKIEDAISYIYKREQGGLSFETLYRGAYSIVTQRHAQTLYEKVEEMMNNQCKMIASETIPCNDSAFLRTIITHWEHYKLSTERIRDILMYLDRKHLSSEEKMSVFEVGVSKFREYAINNTNIAPRITRLVLNAVAKEREGENIDRETLKSLTQILLVAGSTFSDGSSVYRETIEVPLLRVSTEYYHRKGEKLNLEQTAASILKISEEALVEEKERVALCFDICTSESLEKIVVDNLYGNYLESILNMDSGFVSMMKDERTEELKRMLRLFKRRTEGLELLARHLREDVRLRLKEVIPESLQDDPRHRRGKQAATGEKDATVSLIDDLIGVHSHFMKMYVDAFESNTVLGNEINNVFIEQVNGCPRISGLLSHSIDILIRGGGKMDEKSLEKKMMGIMGIFKFVEDKDVFERYYRNHLAKRLLQRTSPYDDLERYAIQLLRNEYGYQFTNRFEGMIQDFRTSKDTNTEFKKSLESTGKRMPFELQVNVLTSVTWPTQAVPNCRLPSEVMDMVKPFELFYLSQHCGRRLTFQTGLGSAILKANFPKSKHEIQVNTTQLSLLLLFNTRMEYTYRELQELTEVPQRLLHRHILFLAMGKFKLLKKDPPFVSKAQKIDPEDKISLNLNFRGKMFRIKIGHQAMKEESPEEKSDIRMRIDEERRLLIEANIVRVMKTKGQLEYLQIIAEVSKLLMSRFKPEPKMIKSRIEDLISRGYLERSPENRKLLLYKA